MDKILKLLEENARYTNEEIAVMTQKTPEEVAETIDRLEKEGVIRGYKPIVDRDKISDSRVFAMIELRVTPKRDLGFDEIAEKIAEYPEVEDVYLMSGGYDLALTVTGKTFKDIAAFVSYDVAKKRSKHPEEFGHGAPEGIAAPEAANNAVSGGAMIPLLTLGIPGDSVTAIMLGALMMQGITPGPLLFSTQTVDVYSIIISLFMANVFMCLLGYGAIRIFSKISLVPMKWLNPIVFVFCVVGTYAINNNIYDVFLMIGAGIVGYFLIKLDFCMPPIILGLILGGTVEENLRRTLVLSDGSFSIFLSHPIALVLLAIAAISLLSPIFLNLWKKRSTNKQSGN